MPRSPIKVLGGLCQSPPNTLIGLRGVKDECPVSPATAIKFTITGIGTHVHPLPSTGVKSASGPGPRPPVPEQGFGVNGWVYSLR